MDQKQVKPKRLDLQGIRALAIIVILCLIWISNVYAIETYGEPIIVLSYQFILFKKIQTILPLYLLIIFASMISLYAFFPETAIETNQESAMHALLFVSNRPKTIQEDYFQMLSIAVDIFTHTWSLSVEVQFYFLVPLIFLILKQIPRRMHYHYYSTIGMLVYLCGPSMAQSQYKLLKSVEEGKTECNQSLLSAGYDIQKNGEENNEKEETSNGMFKRRLHRLSQQAVYASLFGMTCITAGQMVYPSSVVRPLVTIVTGFVMLLSDGNLLLSNRILTYIGDISYSLYLIHWPIYSYWKLSYEDNTSLLILALFSSVVLAVITYEFFEKWYLKLSSTNIGIIVVCLFVLNVVIINKDDIMDHIEGRNFSSLNNITDDMTSDDAERLNVLWTTNDMNNLFSPTCIYESVGTPLGWCRHTGLQKTAKFKLAIIGNSWTANHATMFYQECAHKSKSILQGSAYGCEPVFPSTGSALCKANFTDFAKHIKQEKPDYAFIFTRFISIGAPLPKGVTSFDKDPIYQTMKL